MFFIIITRVFVLFFIFQLLFLFHYYLASKYLKKILILFTSNADCSQLTTEIENSAKQSEAHKAATENTNWLAGCLAGRQAKQATYFCCYCYVGWLVSWCSFWWYTPKNSVCCIVLMMVLVMMMMMKNSTKHTGRQQHQQHK